MKVCLSFIFATTDFIQISTVHLLRWREVGATGVRGRTARHFRTSFADVDEGSSDVEPATASISVSDLTSPLPGEYWQAFEDIEVASAPEMSDAERVEQQLEAMHTRRETETKNALREQLKWIASKGIGLVHKAPVSAGELAFRDKQRQYTYNTFVRTMADFDLDNLQNASINYKPMPLPLEEYLKMINNVRQNRVGLEVESVTASLPDPSVAYTPFHRDIARQKALEKRFRVHYLAGSGRKFPFFYNAEDDCFWKKVEDGTVACVLKEELRKKSKHNPSITVAIDQTGMYDRIEEALFPRTPQCADFYLEKATWTYYCVPDFQDLQIPKDYKKMQRYKNQLNKYHFHQWAVEQSKKIDLPELYRPPRPAGSPPFPENTGLNITDIPDRKRVVLNKHASTSRIHYRCGHPKQAYLRLDVFCSVVQGSSNSLIQQAKAYIRGNHPTANMTISAVDVQYPLQEGVLIVTPHNFTVAAAPALTVVENELLVAGSKKFGKFSYDTYELLKTSQALKTEKNSTTTAR